MREVRRYPMPVRREASCRGRRDREMRVLRQPRLLRQKDFDQRLGCADGSLSLGVALFAGWKFGWIWFTPVLLASVLVDWIVARRIGAVTICYRCDAEYRDLPLNPRHRGYDPHVAERYAETKTLRRMR